MLQETGNKINFVECATAPKSHCTSTYKCKKEKIVGINDNNFTIKKIINYKIVKIFVSFETVKVCLKGKIFMLYAIIFNINNSI